jgi:hypothetical protein
MERRSIFFFFFGIRAGEEIEGPDGPDEELEGAEIRFNYFTKGLLKKGLINFSELRGAKAQALNPPVYKYPANSIDKMDQNQDTLITQTHSIRLSPHFEKRSMQFASSDARYCVVR